MAESSTVVDVEQEVGQTVGQTGGADRACKVGSAARTTGAARAVWVARILVAFVFVVNVQCAVRFVIWPNEFTASFAVAGAGFAGVAAIQGLGVAFLMWNATYPAVIANPLKFRALHVVMIAQQLIGLIGESIIYAAIPNSLFARGGTAADAASEVVTTLSSTDYAAMADSVWAFIRFDSVGLVLLVAAFLLVGWARRKSATHADGANGNQA